MAARPAFTIPLIGSSFDALNAQRFGWQQRNDQVEAANIARANAAQEAQNRYRFDVSRMQQEAMLRDAQAREAAQRDSINLALGERSERENTRRFDLGLKQRGDELKVQERRYQFAADREKKEIEEYDKAQENFAERFRKPFYSAGNEWKNSQKQYEKEQQELARLAQELEALPDEKTLPVGTSIADREKLRKDIANAQAAYFKAQENLAIAKEKVGLTTKQVAAFADNAKRNGFEVDLEKFSFFRPRDNREFGMYPDELVPRATVGPAVRLPQPQPQVTPPVAAPAFAQPPTATATMPQSVPLPRGGGTVTDFSQPKAGPKLTVEGAQFFLQEAKGDKALARQLAREAGYTF